MPVRTVKIALIRILTATLAGALLPGSSALAQPTSTDLQAKALRRDWIATVGPKEVFRGRWSGEALPNTPNAAQGSWTLLSDANRILLEGTWSARKSAGLARHLVGSNRARSIILRYLGGRPGRLQRQNFGRDAETDGGKADLWFLAKRPALGKLVAKRLTVTALSARLKPCFIRMV